jgi:2-keto-4-pentenoate hydratase/2-oxohepta-3-ene-1,7-dioic acid hydratase in catechol pathway
MLDREDKIRDLSAVVPDITGATLGRESLAKLRAVDPASLPLVKEPVRLGACVGAVRNFIAVGLNYEDHARETNAPIPSEPILFNKAPSCIAGPNDDIVIPRGSKKTDWEVELAIVIGEPALYVAEKDALSVVAGYCICNDVSEREFQIERGGQWMKGKSAPSFGPLGPWLVTPDEIADVQNLAMRLDVDGQRMQTGSTKTMIFGVTHLVSYISRFMAMEPGDVITTGTPPGVGLGMKPPRFLKPGETVELSVEGLGVQRQRVVAAAE